MNTSQMTIRDWAMLLLCAVFWGSAYVFNKVTLAELPPLTITASRLTIAAGFLFVLARVSGVSIPPPGRAWLPFFAFTLLSNVVPFLLVLRGQQETASGLAAVLGATTPLFVILLAHVLTHDEKIVGRKMAGVSIGLVGVAIVFGSDVFAAWSTAITAKLALMLASVLYALGAIYSKRLTRYDPLVLATLQMTCGSIVTTPIALAYDRPWTIGPVSTEALAAVVGTAIFGSALAAVTYFHVFRRAGATNAMLVTLMVPVTPILLGAALFGERLIVREIVGALVIALALVIIDGRAAAALSRRWRQGSRVQP